jgi:dTDP-4-amino-4,6-dideoxygalactose transaminase
LVPFLDLRAQYLSLKREIDAAVIEVLESGNYVLGPNVASFERAFADFCGVRNVIACSSGTAALHLALAVLGIGRGDEVVTPAMSFVATAAAVDYCGARPVFVDVDPVHSNMEPSQIEAAISPITKAILPVHLYGQCADMDPILEIARRHALPVIEDAAQAHGAESWGRRAGSLGVMGCFSFYPGKNLGAYGEGGAVVTSDNALAEKLLILRDWGQDRKYYHVLKGFNYRMDSVQGAVLDVKLRHLDDWTASRQRVAESYAQALVAIPDVELPQVLRGNRHVWHVYPIRVPNDRRAAIMDVLKNRGVGTGLHYPIPVHMQPCFAELGYSRGDFPNAERQAAMELSLPIFAEMTQADVAEVAKALDFAVGLPPGRGNA